MEPDGGLEMNSGVPMSTRPLRDEQIAAYLRDGFVRVPGFFDAGEIEPLRRAYLDDSTINGQMYGMLDSDGEAHPICIWTDLGDDIIGMIPRMARMVEATEALLGESCYHWHSKFAIKPPRCPALFEWHQDFYSWYDDGVLFPKMLTVAVAVEPATRENGCLQVIPGSHRMGRIGHGGADPARVKRATEVLGLVHCELDAGDVAFFDCNTLHFSDSNTTDAPRVMLHIAYNAASNEPFEDARGPNIDGAFMNIPAAERSYRMLEKLPDDVLATRRYKSAFHHTRFRSPRLGLNTKFTKAVRMS